jgi:hypothetical protein
MTKKAWEKVGINLMRSPEPSEMRRSRGKIAAIPKPGGSKQLAEPGAEKGPKRLELEL